MRVASLLLSLVAGVALISTAAPAQAPKAAPVKPRPAAIRDWRTNVVMLPDGTYAIGRPAAKVKLVEYLSYTCSHCAQFIADSKGPLHDDLVRRGLVRVEFRHAVRDPLDLAATLLARCAGPSGFSGASQALFATQGSWYPQGAQWWQANGARLQGQPQLVNLKALADASGLSKLMRDRGLAQAAINQCFARPAALTRIEGMSKTSWAVIEGTPSFVINGKSVGSTSWAGLEPQLHAAGAR